MNQNALLVSALLLSFVLCLKTAEKYRILTESCPLETKDNSLRLRALNLSIDSTKPTEADRRIEDIAAIKGLFLLKDLQAGTSYNLLPIQQQEEETIFQATNKVIPPWNVSHQLPSMHDQIKQDAQKYPTVLNSACPNCFVSASCFLTNVSLMYPALGGPKCQFSDAILRQYEEQKLPFNMMFLGDSRMRQIFQNFVSFFAARDSVKLSVELLDENKNYQFWKSDKFGVTLFFRTSNFYDNSKITLKNITNVFPDKSKPLYLLYGTAGHFEHSVRYDLLFEDHFVKMSTAILELVREGLFTEAFHVDELYPLWGTFPEYYYIKKFTRSWLQTIGTDIHIYDSYLLMADLYREICYREHSESEIVLDPFIISNLDDANKKHWTELSRDWYCNNRMHPGRVLFKVVVRQVLGHIFYNYP